MSPFSLFVMYLLIWWVTLFAILPVGIRGQAEEGDVVKGSEPGAPVDSNIKNKFKLTTLIATCLWAVVCAIIWTGAVSWDQLGALMGIKVTPK